MDTHEPSEGLEAPEPDLQEIVSRWAGESRQLLLALPVVLAKLEELKEEREALRNRLMDLEQENLTLRESRENLAESFARLKDLTAPTPPNPPVRDVSSTPPSEPPAGDAAATSATPARDTAPEPSSPSPEPQAVAQAPAAPPAPAPDQANSGPTSPVTEPSPPSPESKEDKSPLPPRVEPSPVRLASVFRPPAKKEAPSGGQSSQSPS
jgi:hypothetical protein